MNKKAEPRIAEAAGHAGGTGAELGSRIEEAMGRAVVEMNKRGIVDDTPPERVEKLLGKSFRGKNGSVAIREAKIAARAAAKAAYREEEAARLARVAKETSAG